MATFVVTLKTSDDSRVYKRLALTLKTALRRDGLKCIDIAEICEEPNGIATASRGTKAATRRQRKPRR
jgi:hypothetical protein